jgi:hypothetical protein
LLAKWRPEKHELLHFIAVFLDRNVWIKQSSASFVECLKLLKATKVVEKVLKAFLKAFLGEVTYYQMTNNHASDTC